MPTDLFVRRALLWLKWSSGKRVTITCSPNFGYRHCLRALGDKTLEGVSLDSVRLLFNGAEPISVELAEEFLDTLAPFGLKRTAMFPVYGLAEASLAVSFPEPGSTYRYITVDRRTLGVGAAARIVEPADPTALKLMCEGRPIPYTEVKLVDDALATVPPDTVGHLLMRGDNVTSGYFQNPEANAAAFATRWLVAHRATSRWNTTATSTSRAVRRKSSSSPGRTITRTISRRSCRRNPGWNSARSSPTAARGAGAPTDELVLFVLHRGDMPDFIPLATRAMHLVNEHAGVEVARVVPVKRIPKTTSGKLQRTALAKAFEDGEFAAEIAEFDRVWEQVHGHGRAAKGKVEQQLKAIVDDVMPGKHVDIDDNLFDVGASSLTLIQIHEKIDELYPGAVDLTELFDFPTISQLSKHLESKLVAAV